MASFVQKSSFLVRQLRCISPHHASSIRALKSRHGFHSNSFVKAVQPYLLADIGEGITECQIVGWSVKPGDKVEQFDPICEVSSDKATVEITSRFDGTIKSLCYEEGEVAQVGEPLLHIDVEGEPDAESASENHSSDTTPTPKQNEATTTIRSGTPSSEPAASAPSWSDRTASELNEEGRKLTWIEKQMFQTMTKSLEIPHFLFTHRLNLANLDSQRKELQQQSGVRISLLAVLTKAISTMMMQHPRLNAHLDTSDPKEPLLITKKSHDFGIAVDTDNGLVVPVVRDVQRHSVQSLTEAIAHLSESARRNDLKPNDLRGASFAVSNIGSFGGETVAPIIVAPMVAIVGLGRAQKYGDRMEMTVSWSADHRIIDGASVAKAAMTLDGIVSDPESLLR